MPQPKPENTSPTHQTLLVLGRPEGGAVDPETSQRAPGGVCFYDDGEEYRAEPGDLIEVPLRQVPGLVEDNICMIPEEFEEVVAWAEAAAIPPPPQPEPEPEPEGDLTEMDGLDLVPDDDLEVY